MTQDPLDVLAPAIWWEPDWSDILQRAGEPVPRKRRPLVTRRRVVIALAVLVAVLIPLTAVGAQQQWWFLAGSPEPASSPVVIMGGTWAGHPWHVVAYRSRTEGLCDGIVEDVTRISNAELGCGPFQGISDSHRSLFGGDPTITATTGAATDLPVHVFGAVVGEARTITMVLETGETLHAATVAAPSSLGDIRFYALRLPASAGPPAKQGYLWQPIDKLTAYDERGNVVACSIPYETHATPLSDCT
jgi:hypothetical protein